MTEIDPMTRSGARWCEKHSRWECSAKVDREHHASAMRGQAYCKNHVGKARELARVQGEANLLAWSAMAGDAGDLRLDPGEVVLRQLRVAVLRADLYGERLRLQVTDDDAAGLVGETFAMGREGQRLATGERVRALAGLEGEWRDRAVRFALAAHGMGIADREIRMAEGQAQFVVSAVMPVLELVPREQRDQALVLLLDGLGVEHELVVGEVVVA